MSAKEASTYGLSRLLALPAELRLRIYEEVLTALDSTIRIYFSYQTHRINPGLGISLLRTCKQIHYEARDVLYIQNTVLLAPEEDLSISPMRIPWNALGKLRQLCIVIDYRPVLRNMTPPWSYGESRITFDFAVYRAMTSLRTLRVCIIGGGNSWKHGNTDRESLIGAFEGFVESVPERCDILLGAETQAEHAFMDDFQEKRWAAFIRPIEVTRNVLEEVMGEVDVVKGAKSGMQNSPAEASSSNGVDQLDEGPRTW